MKSPHLLHVAVTGRALFDLSEADTVYREKGLAAYLEHMVKLRHKTLNPGPAFWLLKALGALKHPTTGENLVYLTLLSQNHAEAGMRLLYSTLKHGLNIDRTAFTGGAPQVPYLRALNADLFLSFSASDVKAALSSGIPAAHLLPQFQPNTLTTQVRIAFDGDAVVFGDASDRLYRKHGYARFLKHEMDKASIPLPAGPFKRFLAKLNTLQKTFPPDQCPIRTALVTARGTHVLIRPLLTLESWGLRVDEAVGLDGTSKEQALKAFSPHIFFDDQAPNCAVASTVAVAGHVPY